MDLIFFQLIVYYNEEKDKKRVIEEIKEYLTHKRPGKSINIFMEELSSNTIVCPECNKEVTLGFSDMDSVLAVAVKNLMVCFSVVEY